MTEQELRALVRQAIARHAVSHSPADVVFSDGGRPLSGPTPGHSSHLMFVVPSGADAEGPCIIEPAVTCNHCGYCQSMGH
jgi:hypothetical protein